MKLIGLTGGIASGKSLVTSMLIKAGIPVIDADDLSREVTSQGTIGLAQIIDHFGKHYLQSDNTLNRKALAALIFSDPKAKEALEHIVHPLIHDAMIKKVNSLSSNRHPYVVYCAALLFEKQLQRGFDAVILLDCSEDIQIQRLMHRDNLSEDDARLRLLAQMPLQDKKLLTPFWVNNNGTQDDCAQSLSKVWTTITGQSQQFHF